ncbi:MAG TPA: ATP-binding cassette domain-containing protein, partial [Polyangiaceae bacterium]
IHGCRVETYPESYLGARALWQAVVEREAQSRALNVAERDALRRRVDEARRMKEAAGRKRSASARMKNRKDHDASSIAADRRAAIGEACISRNLHVLSAKLKRADAAISEVAVDKTLGRSLFVGYQPAAQSRLFGLDGESVQVGGKTLVNDVRVIFERRSRVHLFGRNGAGKSSLIATLWAKAGPIRERCLWLPQTLSSERVRELFQAARSLPPSKRGRLLQVLAALGTDPERALLSPSPSPGEARKLCLAFGMANHAAALILDEPTNHLDLPTIERLEIALAAFPGALLLVSHDRALAHACTTERWEIRHGGLVTA